MVSSPFFKAADQWPGLRAVVVLLGKAETGAHSNCQPNQARYNPPAILSRSKAQGWVRSSAASPRAARVT
ncbi:hypothetical protein D3C78_1604570 [compost metagenome]